MPPAPPDGSQWKKVELGFFDGGPHSVTDPDGEGVYKFVDNDNRFLYLFSSYVGSVPPIQVLQLRGDQILDVSQEKRFYPLHRVRLKDMEDTLRSVKGNAEMNGLLAGYVATKAIVGEFDSGWAVMEQRYERESDWGLRDCQGGYNDQGQCKGKEIIYPSFPGSIAGVLDRSWLFIGRVILEGVCNTAIL